MDVDGVAAAIDGRDGRDLFGCMTRGDGWAGANPFFVIWKHFVGNGKCICRILDIVQLDSQ
jgi:hypothetical protein